MVTVKITFTWIGGLQGRRHQRMVWRQALEELLGVPIELHQRLSDEADNEPLLQIFCSTLSQFLLNPMNNNTSIFNWYEVHKQIHHSSTICYGYRNA